MEEQKEPVSAGKTDVVKDVLQKKVSMVREALSIAVEVLQGIFRSVYPNFVRKMGWMWQVLLYLIIFAAIGLMAWYLKEKFMEYIVPIIAVVIGVTASYIVLYKTEAPEHFWHFICRPFVAMKKFFFGSKLRIAFSIVGLIPLVLMIFIGRGVYHPLVSELMPKLANVFVMCLMVVTIFFYYYKKPISIWRITVYRRTALVTCVLAFALMQWTGLVDIMSYNKRNNDLQFTDIYTKPLSKGVYWEVAETIDNQLFADTDTNEMPSESDLMLRLDKDVGYTAGITPRSWVTRLVNPLDKGGYIAVSTNPAIKNEEDREVRIPIEKSLFLGRDSEKATIKKFGFLEYFTSKIGNTIRLVDEKGDLYLVTQVDRLRGFPNAYYAPNGVYISKAGDEKPRWKFWLFGAGTYVSPEETKDYPFLNGQSLISKRSLEQLGNSGRFSEGYMDAFFTRANGVVPNMLNDKILHNIVYIDEELGGKHYTGLASELQMVSFAKPKSLNRTWIIPLSGNRNTVYVYNNFKEKDRRVPPSFLVPSILDGLAERSMNESDYRVIDIHVIKTSIDGEVIEAYMSTVEKRASSEEERGKDLNPNRILTVLDPKNKPHSDRYDPKKTEFEQVEEMHRALFRM